MEDPRDYHGSFDPLTLHKHCRCTPEFRASDYFYLSKAVLPYLHAGSAIINTTSITAYKGSPHLLDYAATKGAIVAFTRSLALAAGQILHPNGGEVVNGSIDCGSACVRSCRGV